MNYIKIIRPGNFIFVGLCILFGALYPDFRIFEIDIRLISGLLSGMLIAAGGYVVNDYYDLEIDLINKPGRVLPSGKMSRSTALYYSIGLFIVGIILGYFTGSVICLLLAFINSTLLFLYASIFKRQVITGNLLVAYASGSAFIYGGVITDNLSNSLIIAVFAFFYTFLREIVKAMEDKKGDQENGAITVAVCWQKRSVLLLCLVPLIGMIFFMLYLYINMLLQRSQFVLLSFFVVLPLLVFYQILVKQDTEKSYRLISQMMKLDMLLLLIIFSIGRII